MARYNAQETEEKWQRVWRERRAFEVETDPAKRKTLVVEFQKITTLESPNLPLVELESITVASTKVQNHSNDPNYLAATWHDIWLAS